MTRKLWLLGDIGGTNARFATCEPGNLALSNSLTLETAAFTGPHQAIRRYLRETEQESPAAMCIAVAGPITNGEAQLTNSHWRLSVDSLQSHWKTSPTLLLNDYQALAYALPTLARSGNTNLNGPPLREGKYRKTYAVLGPGTGLGAAGLVANGDLQTVLTTEAGHANFAPTDDTQAMLLARLWQRYPQVSNERLLSGQGIENLYWALSMDTNMSQAPDRSAAEIFERSRCHDDRCAKQAVGLFFRILGQVAGDLALTLGALDGIFIAGGIAQRHKAALLHSEFREGFEAKGAQARLMRTIPTLIIDHPQPGLLGASKAAAFHRE